jgi:Colicin V production protein
MMLWLLALVLLASLAGIGFRQGVIRVAFAFVGIVMGALLAGLLAKPVRPLLVALGLKTPALAWLLAPVVVFLIISIAFKIGGYFVHHKVDVYFKYQAGDLRLALWERLSRRLGLCLALANGALYLILIATAIYPLSYWTFQLSSAGQDPALVKVINRLGEDMQATGFAKVARALDPMPRVWYDSADLAGLLYNNALIDARVSRYPAFLGLAERQEFQDMAKDTEFNEMRLRREPIMKLLDQSKVQAILQNPELLKVIWATVVPDMQDLQAFLVSGKSPKYGPEKLLGRWTFNVNVAMALFRQAKPNISSKEMQNWKRWMVAAFSKTSFVAMTDHQAILKDVPQLRPPSAGAAAASGPQTLKGEWKSLDGKYQLNLSGGARDETLAATVEGERLTIAGQGMGLVFDRED